MQKEWQVHIRESETIEFLLNCPTVAHGKITIPLHLQHSEWVCEYTSVFL